jgi:hypothetical protein
MGVGKNIESKALNKETEEGLKERRFWRGTPSVATKNVQK